MERSREIEILFRRLRLYDDLGRRAEGLIRTIQRELKERYGSGSCPFRNRAHARPGRKAPQRDPAASKVLSTAAAELLLGRMHAKIDDLCAERERLKREQGGPTKGRVLGGRSW